MFVRTKGKSGLAAFGYKSLPRSASSWTFKLVQTALEPICVYSLAPLASILAHRYAILRHFILSKTQRYCHKDC